MSLLQTALCVNYPNSIAYYFKRLTTQASQLFLPTASTETIAVVSLYICSIITDVVFVEYEHLGYHCSSTVATGANNKSVGLGAISSPYINKV